jgi:hypothetical protein
MDGLLGHAVVHSKCIVNSHGFGIWNGIHCSEHLIKSELLREHKKTAKSTAGD